jgi:two-component system response regulator FlrC
MDLGLQAKLLRVLQEQEVERIGGRKVISLDVRVLATTNRKLESYVKEGKFREDLFYRLNVFPLQWKPLRERKLDIAPLAERLFRKYCQKMHRSPVSISNEVKQSLTDYAWPGNVRELDNVVQRALILQAGTEIGVSDLMLNPDDLPQTQLEDHEATSEDLAGQLGEDMRQHEYQLIIDALKATNGSRKEASEKLGISPRTLRYKLAKMREIGLDLDKLLGR